MSNVDVVGGGGGEIQTNIQAAITGSAKCGSSWLDRSLDNGSRLRMNNGFISAYENGTCAASPDDGEYCAVDESDSTTQGCVSGAALIIDWRRRRCRDETVEESVRVGALNLVASTAPGTYIRVCVLLLLCPS